MSDSPFGRLVCVSLVTIVLASCGSDDDNGAMTMRAAADRAGLFVGAGFVEGSHTEEFREVLVREYNSVTAPLYWSSTEPEEGTFDFGSSDVAVELAEAQGLRLRGHPLVWGRLALPGYVNAAPDAATLRRYMSDHITALVSRYRGRIAQYDVVNEPMTFFGAAGPDGDGIEQYVFTELLGPGYVREALELAHAADPQAQLYVNENLVLRPGAKQDFFFELVRDLVDGGVPLHGVGFQGHITPPFAPDFAPTRAEIEQTLRRFADLGLEVEITEIDVTMDDPANQLELQKEIYRDLTAGCLSVAACRGITTWGISDAFTWIEGFFGVRGAPLPFDENFQPKPAYDGIREALAGH
jgi:endo-1,4-beta-xylanase